MENDKKVKSRELMRSMFTDIKSVIDRNDYLNNKSTEIINKKIELGYKSGKLDLRSFENFYNEISKKTQVEVEELYEVFLNFINSTSVELIEEKIIFFEKMLYIFFSKTDEQLNFWKFYQKKFEDKNIAETLKRLKFDKNYDNNNVINEKFDDNETEKMLPKTFSKEEMEKFLLNINEVSETSILKAELLIFEKIQKIEKEIKLLESQKEYDLLYEKTDEIELVNEKIARIDERKEYLLSKLKEFEEILKSNFYEKESVFLFIESILLGIGEVFNDKKDDNDKISITKTNGTNYLSLLNLFKEILTYTEFDVKDMNDKEFLEFLQRNKVKLVEIFAIVLTDILENLKKNRNRVVLNDLLLVNNYQEYNNKYKGEREDIEEQLKKGALENKGLNEKGLLKKISLEYKDIYMTFLKETNAFLKKIDVFFTKYKNVLEYNLTKQIKDILKLNDDNAMEISETLADYYKYKKKIFFKENEIIEFEKITNKLIEYKILKEIVNKETGSVDFSFVIDKTMNFSDFVLKETKKRRIVKNEKEKESSEEEKNIEKKEEVEIEKNNREHLLTEEDMIEFITEKSNFFKKFKEEILVRYIRLNVIISNFINKNIFFFSKETIKNVRKKISQEFLKLKDLFSYLEKIELNYTFELISFEKVRLKNKLDIKQLMEDIENNIQEIIKEIDESFKSNEKIELKTKTWKISSYYNENFMKNVIEFKKYLKKCELETKELENKPVIFFANHYNEILKYSVDNFKNNAGLTKKINFVKTNNIEIKLNLKDDKIINEIQGIATIKNILFNSQFEIIVDKIYKNNEYEFNSDKKFASFVINTILFNKKDKREFDEDNINAIKDLGLCPLNEDDIDVATKTLKNNYDEKFGIEDLKLILHYLKE